MDTSDDLREELDRSFGDGPAHRPLGDRLEAGHRTLLRRRLATGAAMVAVLAVIGTVVGVTGPGGDSASRRLDPATQDSTTPAVTTEVQTSTPKRVPSDPDADVELTPSGSVVTAVGVEVIRRIPNPLGLEAPDRSIAIAYTKRSETTWALLTYEPQDDGSATASSASDPAGKSFATLDDWVADQVALQQGEPPPFTFVRFGQGETLVPLEGVQILQQTGEVDLPANFAGPDDRSAVAEVAADGRRWWVLARQVSGSPPEYIATAGPVGGDNLADFMAYAAQQYASNEGLR